MRGLREIDRILRGDVTSAANLRERGLALQLGHVILANLLLAAFAGICLGVFGIANREKPEFQFMVADAIKVPLLFLLTLVITFPSLYVFNALVGSPLGVLQLGRLMAAAFAVLLAVLASFGPIVAFFAVTSTSYPFIILLNVAVFVVAGWFGVDFLWRTMVKLTTPKIPPLPPRPVAPRPAEQSEGGVPLPRREPELVERYFPPVPDRAVTTVFFFWIVAFALVGMQMSWVLRPFIGRPDVDFAWFRPRASSFFEAVFNSIRILFGG